MVALVAMSFLMVQGIWRAGDAACEAAKHTEVLPDYGYPVQVDPCNDGWAAGWMAPAW